MENNRTSPLDVRHLQVARESLEVVAHNLSSAKEGGGKNRRYPLVVVAAAAAVVERAVAT